MENELNASQDIPSDDELSRAADGAGEVKEEATEESIGELEKIEEAQEEAPEETPEPEEGKSDDKEESNADRSRLGRRLKRAEDTINALLQRITDLQPAAIPAAVAEESDDYIKASDVPKIIARQNELARVEQTKYETDYVATVVALGGQDELSGTDQDEIFNIMQNAYNARRTGQPALDAELNYRAAYANFVANKVKEPKNPLKGGKPKEALGVGASTTNTTSLPKKTVKLDAHAADLVKSMGISDEEVASILSGNTSNSLRNNKK